MQPQILSIHPKDAVPTSVSGKLVSARAAAWERDPASGKETARPAVFELGGGPTTLLVRVQAAGADASAGYEVRGTHGGAVLFSGQVSGKVLAAGPADVEVKPLAEPDRFLALHGDVSWTLDAAGKPPAPAGRTPLELYWMPRDAHLPFDRGVPVELLRDLGSALAADGPRVPLAVNRTLRSTVGGAPTGMGHDVASVVKWCFNRNPPRYDVWQGANYFTDIPNYPVFNNVTLYLSRYLAASNNPNAICNCYDQAAVLQYYLRTIGVTDVKYCFMKPFGYLALTPLIGRGMCNNPFYMSNNTEIVVSETDSNRTAFGNHAFCFLVSQGHIADSCAGPHTGDQSVAAYVASATDGTTPHPPRIRRGTVKDIHYYAGVTKVNRLSSSKRESDEVRAFKDAVGFAERPAPVPAAAVAAAGAPGAAGAAGMTGVACEWPDPRQAPVLSGTPWNLSYEEVIAGPGEALKFWRLNHGNEEISLSVYVASDGTETAQRRFLNLGSTHQMERPVFTKGPPALGHSSAMFKAPGRSRYLWTYHNVTFDVHSVSSNVDLEALAHWFQQKAESSVVPDLAKHLPPVDVTPPPQAGRVGAEVTVGVKARPGHRLESLSEPEALRLVEERDDAFTFRAEQKGQHEVTVVAVDPKTLLVSSRTVTVPAN